MTFLVPRTFLDRSLYVACMMFLWLTPFVNNINGASIKFLHVSVIGPIFYTGFFIIFSLLGLVILPKNKQAILSFTLLGTAIWFLSHLILDFSSPSDIQNFIKFTYPFIVYLTFSHALQASHSANDEKLRAGIKFSILSYLLIIILSFIARYNHYEIKPGYYGFVDGINDLILMLIISGKIFLDELVKGSRAKYITYLIGLILTASKSVLIFIPYYLLLTYRVIRKHSGMMRVKKRFLIIAGILATIVLIPVTKSFLDGKDYMADWDLVDIAYNNQELLYRELTYGRSVYLTYFIENFHKKSLIEMSIGSGMQQGLTYISEAGNKVGIEMDPPDVLNTFGLLGVAIWLFFYVIFPISLRNHAFTWIVVLVTAYSCLGGHLTTNPISGTMFGIILATERVSQKNVRTNYQENIYD